MNEPAEQPAAAEQDFTSLPEGDYAIVELFGHTTLVGKICEVERFGTKMLAIEPMFSGKLLEAVYHGGAAIYRLSPCSREIAWKRQPRREWELPAAIRAVMPTELLPPPDEPPSFDPNDCVELEDDEVDDE